VLGFSLCLIGATIGLHVEDARGVGNDEIRALTDSLSAAIKKRTGEAPVLDLGGTACQEEDRCAALIRSRTGASRIVFLNLLGVSTRIRFVAERSDAGADVLQQAQADLKRDPASWPAALDGVVLILFPEVTAPAAPAAPAAPEASAPAPAPAPAPPSPAQGPTPSLSASSSGSGGAAAPAPAPAPPPADPPITAQTSPEPASGPGIFPWVLAGTGAICLGVGIVLGVQSQNARDTLAHQPTSPADQPGLRSQAVDGAIAADILFGLAALGGTAGLLSFLDVF
jgi:hypothetical protein